MTNTASPVALSPERIRLSIELSKPVSLLLDYIVEVTGGTRSQVAAQVLCDALPGLVDRTDFIGKRARELSQAKPKASK